MVQHAKEGYCKLLHGSRQRRTSELTTQPWMNLNARHVWMKQMPPEMPCRVNKSAPLWANDYKKVHPAPRLRELLFKRLLLRLGVHCFNILWNLGGNERGSMSHHMGLGELAKMECGYCLVIAGILLFLCWEVLSWAVILVAKSKRGDCETALAPLLGFLIGFVIADLCRVKAARENPGFGLYKIPSFPMWPSSLGPSVHSCSLLRRWPGFDSPSPRFSQRTPAPHRRRRYPPNSSTPLLSEVIFSSTHPFGPVGSR